MRSHLLKKDADKRALIERLSAERVSLMFYYDEEPPDTLAHTRVRESVFVVTPPYDYETLEKWLYLGNWQAVSPANGKYKPIDTYRAKANEVEKALSDANVELIIDSFHDDIDWNVIEKT